MKFKKCIDAIKPYVPGKPIEEVKKELGLEKIIKLASNENDLGLSEKVKQAIIENLDEMYIYPDGGAWKLKEKLAKYLNIDINQIILGNGSNEIIEFIAKGFLNEGDEVISSEYSFLVYPLLTQVNNAKFIETPSVDYAYDLNAIAQAINAKTKIIFLANPNNPTGTIFFKSDFEKFMEKVPRDIIVCLDEAYYDFVENEEYPNGIDYINKYKNLIVLRTFSKAYGLAGFRLGCGIANESLITYFNKIRQPFNVNALAQIAGCAVLDDIEYLQKSKDMVSVGKQFLYSQFDEMQLNYIKSETNFILLDIEMDSVEFFKLALERGIIVRDMKAYKLHNFIRVTIGNEQNNKKFIDVLKEIRGI